MSITVPEVLLCILIVSITSERTFKTFGFGYHLNHIPTHTIFQNSDFMLSILLYRAMRRCTQCCVNGAYTITKLNNFEQFVVAINASKVIVTNDQ